MNTRLGSPILAQIDLPNALTLGGLGMSLLAGIAAITGNFHVAICLLIWAGMVDLLDGYVARKTKRTELMQTVGKHLDSVCDVCSFGFAPAVIAFAYGLRSVWEIGILVGFTAAAALRLAYFGAVGMTGGEGEAQAYFTGLPVTYAALVLPMAYGVGFWVGPPVAKSVVALTYLLLASAMVSGIPVPKPGAAWYGRFALLAVALSALYLWAAFR